MDPFDNSKNIFLDPASVKDMPPLVTPEQEQILKNLNLTDFKNKLKSPYSKYVSGEGLKYGFDSNAAWIQTFSGRRFNPTCPNYKAIVIQDIAHSLANICRFTGHSSFFYSVAQHSVLVSYFCNFEDALWGLLHDASESYLTDIPRPLKQSGEFDTFLKFEKTMQDAVCKRFSLNTKEPESVKKADQMLLSTEAKALMQPFHSDWKNIEPPIPINIESWEPKVAKDMFLKRFFELIGEPEHFFSTKKLLNEDINIL